MERTSSSFKSMTFSHEKAEKVVKPPQKPMINRCTNWLFSDMDKLPQKRPIRNEPRIFTVSVARGKEKETYLAKSKPTL